MSRELYLYWRVPARDLEAALQAARALQAQVCGSFPALQARLLQRPSSGETATVMEVYTAAGGVPVHCQQQIETLGAKWLAQWLNSASETGCSAPAGAAYARHVEVFEPVP